MPELSDIALRRINESLQAINRRFDNMATKQDLADVIDGFQEAIGKYDAAIKAKQQSDTAISASDADELLTKLTGLKTKLEADIAALQTGPASTN